MTKWALLHVNSDTYVGRFGNHWTVARSEKGAYLMDSPDEAHNALQALREESQERIGRQPHAEQRYWDWYGGLVEVRQVEDPIISWHPITVKHE